MPANPSGPDLRAVRDKAAFVGVGTSAYGTFPELGVERLMARAFTAALDDAGLRREDVDGIALNMASPAGMDYDQLIDVLGLDVRMANQTWTHGRIMTNAIVSAALMVASGLLECVAFMAAANRVGEQRLVGALGTQQDDRVSGGAHHEHPHFGQTSPGGSAAMAMQYYLERFNQPREALATIPLTFRQNALLNPAAVMRQRPMTADDYFASRFICEPLRLFDYCLTHGGAVCLLLTSAERARDLRRPPVYLRGMQTQGGWRGSGTTSTSLYLDWFAADPADTDIPRNRTVFEMAEVGPKDIDAFYCYDAFSPTVLFTLERFGFCGPGEGLDWIQGGRIGLGGELPVNTHGGLLSETHVSGWNHLAEMVRQLRGECGERQVRGAELAQWAVGDSSIILRR